jgi:stage V sporulation protein SpoVS
MAIAVIGGLVLSTALSLIVVPAFYVVADKLAGKKRKREDVEAHGAWAAESGTK